MHMVLPRVPEREPQSKNEPLTRVIDVVYCVRNVRGEILVINAEMNMPSAFSAIAREKGTKSPTCTVILNDDQFTDAMDRDLIESIEQNEELKGKINLLVQVLQDVAASPTLDSTESANIRQAILKVGSSHRASLTDHYV